ncbi:translocase of chloroplast 159 [Carex littledalei]|uniref:Translocase of chloroplast 159 n=1 Tax=Carex littledalei TaxID=544730 RepID=A0A833VFX5_9POAL|nr:translocase of chloroplast 159 [Carex littledalei]
MSSNQTLVSPNEEEVPEPVKETNAVDSHPIPTEENLNSIEANSGVVNPEKVVVVEEEERGGAFDDQLDKVETSDTQLEKEENSDAKLENSEKTDEQLETDVISGDQVGKIETTEVQADETAEKFEAQGEEDPVFSNTVDENEKNVEEEVVAEKNDEQSVNDAVSDNKRGENDIKVISGDQVGESETTKVQADEVAEKFEAQGKEDAVSGNTVDGNEKNVEEEVIAEKNDEQLVNDVVSDNKGSENEKSEGNKEEDAKIAVPEGEKWEETEKSDPLDDDREGGRFEPEIEPERLREEVTVSNMKEDGQTAVAENPNADQPIVFTEEVKPKVLICPPVETVPVPVTGTVIANGVEDSDVPDVKGGIPKGDSENLTREGDAFVNSTEVEAENENIPIRGDESEEPKEIEVADDYGEVFMGDELEEDEMEGLGSQPARVAILESTEAKEIMKEIEEASAGIDGQLVSDSDEEMEEGIEFEDDDEEGEDEEDREGIDSALAALLKAATGGDGNFMLSSQDDSMGLGTGSRIFKMDRPAGLGPSAPALRPRPTGTTPARPSSQLAAIPTETGTVEEMSEEERALHEKIESIRVKFLRLVHRSGHSPEDTVARQVLHRLSLAEGFRRGRMTGAGIGTGTSIEAAWKKALQLEAITGAGTDDLNFSVNILVLGKAGVGKSATINSIFNSEVTGTNPFGPSTRSVQVFTDMVDGIKFRVIDAPGLKTSVFDQNANRKILARVKSITKKCPPDIVLYVDRIDTQTRDMNDLPLLRTITSVLGSSIWFNAIVALTHAGLAPPDGPNGSPLTYESFVAQRSHVVQLAVRQGAGDMRLMNPVALVENHQSCRRNRDGHKILPNGQSWRQQLLLLCYSSKILSEANELLKLQDGSNSAASKLFGFRFRSPPLPFLLSSLLQTRAHPKLANDQAGDINGDSDVELDDFSDHEEDEEDEYDQLPPFKPLRKSQIAKLSKEQRKAYFEEYEYRVKLLQKRQWREEVRRMKEMKRRKEKETGTAAGFEPGEDDDQDNAPASVQVPLPDMVLPPSFDCDAPTYRYRFLEPTSGFLARPVLDTHGWDHDCGYDGVSLEETLALAGMFPANVSAQITKDKKEFSIHLESAVSSKHGDNGSSLAGFDIQTIGRQLGYIVRGETKFKNLKRNKTTGGVTVTFLGDIVATGAKLEDQLSIGKRLTLVASTGAVRAQGDIAYGANLEARLRDKDYPIGQALTTLGLSLMKWRGDLALGANLQSQIPIGSGSKVALRVGLNNKLSGQVTVRTSTSDHFQIALLALVPVVSSVIRNLRGGGGESFAY